MNIIDGFCYDDVLLIPQHSEIESRANISVEVDLGKGVQLSGPFISANMKTVTGPVLADKMDRYGMGILHRFDTLEQQVANYHLATHKVEIPGSNNPYKDSVGISVGISSVSENNRIIEETSAKVVCIDVAHGDHARVLKEISRIAKRFPNILLIAGNVATGAGAKRLESAGADVVKVGVGPGSLCTTRIETGNGVPQLSALVDVYNALGKDHSRSVKIIADGGIKKAGDVVKALCFSDAVMLGSVLAGTEEAPGDVITDGDRKYKRYAGSSTHKTNRVEGVAGLTPYKGPVEKILEVFKEGLQSGLSYQGCDNLIDLREAPQFVRISSAGLVESRPHANIK